jgi:hypothetical protein
MKRLVALPVLLCAIGAHAQVGAIDPTWVYVSPIKWQHAPRGIHERTGAATVAVLFPEGRYAEVSANLVQNDATRFTTFSDGEGTLIRVGTWSRTDDHAIRIHSRNVFRDDHVFIPPYCGRDHCAPDDPGPYADDNCTLEGSSKTHLAQTIHCRRLMVSPLTLNLDLNALASYTQPK